MRWPEDRRKTRSLWEEFNPSQWSDEERQFFREALEKIPAVEADAIELAMNGAEHREIARVFDVDQSTISYRIRRAGERIQWLADRPPRPESFERDLRRVLEGGTREPVERRVEVVMHLSESTSQSATARAYGMRQTHVRDLFGKALRRLRAKGLTASYQHLAALRGNWNVLR
jgi:DNA-directed RNA polymerase specialized sigma24 family protein